jgi:hypothetical protein
MDWLLQVIRRSGISIIPVGGGVFVSLVARFCRGFAVVKIENISGVVSIWWVEFFKQAVPF